MSRVSSLPKEVAEQVLVLCHPRDVAAFAQTCRAAFLLVNDPADQYLWRQLFLFFPFDDPRKTRHGFCKDMPFDWKSELQRRVLAESIARSTCSTSTDLHATLSILLGVVRSASPVDPHNDRVPSFNLQWVTNVLRSTNVLQQSCSREHACQIRARLRSYLALTLDDGSDEESLSNIKSIRIHSRCYVYNLNSYTKDNDWGPFIPKTGKVDWFQVECIVNVISLNLADDFSRHFLDARPPCGLAATRPYSAPHATSLASHDWAGVEGNWRRIVSFMDYRDLFAFNFSIRGRSSRTYGGSFFEDPHFSEATRLIELQFHLITLDEIPNYYVLGRFPQSQDTNYPTLYFSGSSRGVNGNEAVIVGSVYMACDNVVRWRFVSVREGRMQWSSEGVQIGGIASAMGVVGIWTGAHHERGDPAGPFWLWKVPDDCLTSVRALVTTS